MSSPTQAAGSAWELRAAELLERHGLRVIDRGYRCRSGELDLVCRHGDQLVVVEVRARRARNFGGAAASIDGRKIRKIVSATRHYLLTHPQFADASIRFDVVTIDDKDSATPEIHWIRSAFEAT